MGWQTIATERISPLARTAVFRIAGWDATRDTPYRVVYRWQGRDHAWEGVVRHDPVEKPELVVAAFTGDNGYVFPQTRLVRNVRLQNPDLLFFSGDQIYESYGGFGIQRAPVEVAMLDYLRKFHLFGWTWRELLKDRPSAILPDDHDVYQGNLWGQGGRKIPNADGDSIEAGGYVMPPAWVNAVQRTQTGQLPDPVDPAPCEQGIEVYFTDMLYGWVSFAILEDRKFKTGPNSAFHGKVREARQGGPAKLDVPHAELLGPRQERFLEHWAQDWRGADMKVALSQTIWCEVTTHAGRELKPHGADLDSGGWPPSKRKRALDLLRRGFAFSIHGDQHSGALVHQGIDDWEDGPISFMVVGTANGFPRAWWPDHPGENHQPGRARWTGRYFDALGNRITVLAAANPEPGANKLRDISPEELAHRKGSGHGIVRLNKAQGTATFEMWHHGFDAAHPKPDDQFEDFPQTWSMFANHGGLKAWLPELVVTGMTNPVVQLIDEQTREVIYTVRIRSTRFRPKAPREGRYALRVGEPGTARERILPHLQAVSEPVAEPVSVRFGEP